MRSEKSVKTVNTLKDKPSHFKEESEIVTRYSSIRNNNDNCCLSRVKSRCLGARWGNGIVDKEGGYRVAG